MSGQVNTASTVALSGIFDFCCNDLRQPFNGVAGRRVVNVARNVALGLQVLLNLRMKALVLLMSWRRTTVSVMSNAVSRSKGNQGFPGSRICFVAGVNSWLAANGRFQERELYGRMITLSAASVEGWRLR